MVPEYSPDGKYIYFNSVRSGLMQIWRMQPDGTNQEQITNDEFNNWFPHISPDGQWIAFISFPKDIDPTDHPYYKRVYLRLMPASGGPAKVIGYVYGGPGHHQRAVVVTRQQDGRVCQQHRRHQVTLALVAGDVLVYTSSRTHHEDFEAHKVREGQPCTVSSWAS